MPDEKTVLRRAYFVVVLSILVLLITVTIISRPSMVLYEDQCSSELFFVPSPDMLYYPTEDEFFSVFLDERLVNKEASEPVLKTEEDRINDYICFICEGYRNVTPELIKSVIVSESSYNPKAKNGDHIGLMQISKRWHNNRAIKLGVEDLYDPYGNILVGTDYLDELIGSSNGDIVLALMIYNMGYQEAYRMYSNGQISHYASTILSRL